MPVLNRKSGTPNSSMQKYHIMVLKTELRITTKCGRTQIVTDTHKKDKIRKGKTKIFMLHDNVNSSTIEQ